MTNEWIPCADGLPDMGERVLASTDRYCYIQIFRGVQNSPELWWWNDNTIQPVKAWQRLPEPYGR